jgi:hypothetical protein
VRGGLRNSTEGLVEQDQSRLRRESAGELHQPQLAICQPAGERIGPGDSATALRAAIVGTLAGVEDRDIGAIVDALTVEVERLAGVEQCVLRRRRKTDRQIRRLAEHRPADRWRKADSNRRSRRERPPRGRPPPSPSPERT